MKDKDKNKEVSGASVSPDKPRVILKEGVHIWIDHPIPQLTIIANEQGLRELAAFFIRCADEWANKQELYDCDAEAASHEHWHIDFMFRPLEEKYSDHIEIRIVPFAEYSRSTVFKRYGVSTKTRRRDDLITRAKDLIRKANEMKPW